MKFNFLWLRGNSNSCTKPLDFFLTSKIFERRFMNFRSIDSDAGNRKGSFLD